MSDLEEDASNTTFFEEPELDTENGENSTENSSNSSSPIDNETTDPSYAGGVGNIVTPTTRLTRSQRRRSLGDIPIDNTLLAPITQ